MIRTHALSAQAAEPRPTVPRSQPGARGGASPGAKPAPDPAIRRFHGRVALNPIRVGTDAGKIGDEVLSHLAGLRTRASRCARNHSRSPDGASDHVVRTVTENCRTLKFESQGFERE